MKVEVPVMFCVSSNPTYWWSLCSFMLVNGLTRTLFPGSQRWRPAEGDAGAAAGHGGHEEQHLIPSAHAAGQG